MLSMLASVKTLSSYKLLKELLISHPPVSGTRYIFSYLIRDSLQLSKTLFPEVAGLYTNSMVGPDLIRLAVQLVDSGLVSLGVVSKGFEPLVLELAQKQYAEFTSDKNAYPDYYSSVIDMLGKLNTKDAVSLLYKYIDLERLDIKEQAVIAVLKGGHPVDKKELNKLAESHEWRVTLYEDLEKINKVHLFPKAFLTQEQFAQSYLYTFLMEDEESTVKKIHITGEKLVDIDNKKYRYFICKVTDIEGENYLAICGHFDVDRSNVYLKYDEVNLRFFYEEKYSSSRINKLFDEYIAVLRTAITSKK
jgi:hypothetical protein